MCRHSSFLYEKHIRFTRSFILHACFPCILARRLVKLPSCLFFRLAPLSDTPCPPSDLQHAPSLPKLALNSGLQDLRSPFLFCPYKCVQSLLHLPLSTFWLSNDLSVVADFRSQLIFAWISRTQGPHFSHELLALLQGIRLQKAFSDFRPSSWQRLGVGTRIVRTKSQATSRLCHGTAHTQEPHLFSLLPLHACRVDKGAKSCTQSPLESSRRS